uniref:WAP domain-containing protein n=1 Tax=Trichuris muris TaxID=70415 RepID=A0A5S6Q3I1_TRIMR
MLPDADRVLCPNDLRAQRTCLTNSDCPESQECYKPKLICCFPESSDKAGMCPPLVIPENWSQTGENHCSQDSDCQGTRKCCLTLLGTRCLLPTLSSC